jgi:hypothetical protein
LFLFAGRICVGLATPRRFDQRPSDALDEFQIESSAAFGKRLFMPQRLHEPLLVFPCGVSMIQ